MKPLDLIKYKTWQMYVPYCFPKYLGKTTISTCLLLPTFALCVLELKVSIVLGQQRHYGIIAQLSS